MVIANPDDITGSCPQCKSTLNPCADWYIADGPNDSGMVHFMREMHCIKCMKLFTALMGIEIVKENINAEHSGHAQKPDESEDESIESPDAEDESSGGGGDYWGFLNN